MSNLFRDNCMYARGVDGISTRVVEPQKLRQFHAFGALRVSVRVISYSLTTCLTQNKVCMSSRRNELCHSRQTSCLAISAAPASLQTHGNCHSSDSGKMLLRMQSKTTALTQGVQRWLGRILESPSAQWHTPCMITNATDGAALEQCWQCN